jgi:hypothetical protein
MTKKTDTTKKANATSKTTVDAIKTTVDTAKLDFEFLRRNQTRVLKADEIDELKTELEKVVTVEQNNKYKYAFSVILDNKKFCEIWGKSDALRVTVCKRNLEKLIDCKVVNLAERTAIRQEKDTREEYEVQTEFVLTKAEVIEILKFVVEYAQKKTEEKQKAKAESKKESKKATKKESKKAE